MTSVRGLEKFIELQDKIIELLNQEAQDLRSRFSWKTTGLTVFCILSLTLYIIVISTFIIIFIDTLILEIYNSSWPQLILVIIRVLAAIVVVVSLPRILLFPANMLSSKYITHKKLIAVLQSVFFIPFYIMISVLLIDFLDGNIDIRNIVIFLVVILFFLLSVFMFSYGIFVVLCSTPRGFFLVLTSSKLSNLKTNHDVAVVQIVKNAKLFTRKWNNKDFVNVDIIAENKRDSLVGQLQSTAIILTTIGLISILVLVVPSAPTESFFNLLDTLLEAINQYFGGENQNSKGITEMLFRSIAFIILGFIVFISYFYFSYSYTVLRAIEIIQLICHSEITKSQQQENGFLRNISLTARLLAGRFSRSDKSSKPQ